MAKKAKKTVEITVKTTLNGVESVDKYEGDGSYVAFVFKDKDGSQGSILGSFSQSRDSGEAAGMLMSLCDIIKKMISRSPFLMGALLAYLDGDVSCEAFRDVGEDLEREIFSREKKNDDQSEAPKAKATEADEAKAAEGGGDDGEDH